MTSVAHYHSSEQCSFQTVLKRQKEAEIGLPINMGIRKLERERRSKNEKVIKGVAEKKDCEKERESKKHLIDKERERGWAVVVAQLVERSLPIPEACAVRIQSSAKIYIEHLLSTVLKRQR